MLKGKNTIKGVEVNNTWCSNFNWKNPDFKFRATPPHILRFLVQKRLLGETLRLCILSTSPCALASSNKMLQLNLFLPPQAAFLGMKVWIFTNLDLAGDCSANLPLWCVFATNNVCCSFLTKALKEA